MDVKDQDRTAVWIALGGALLAAIIAVSRHNTSSPGAADARPTLGIEEPSRTGPQASPEHGGADHLVVDFAGHTK
jgi:hypothetical protein